MEFILEVFKNRPYTGPDFFWGRLEREQVQRVMNLMDVFKEAHKISRAAMLPVPECLSYDLTTTPSDVLGNFVFFYSEAGGLEDARGLFRDGPECHVRGMTAGYDIPWLDLDVPGSWDPTTLHLNVGLGYVNFQALRMDNDGTDEIIRTASITQDVFKTALGF